MSVLPNTGVTTPTVGGSSGTWGTETNAAWSNYDDHDHSSGKGKRINTDAISIDADLTLASYGITNIGKAAFAAVTALAAGSKTLFVSSSDNELYWRTNAGTNVKLTSGTSLNVSAFVGGIGGDYTSAAAALNYDDANKRYTFRTGGGTNWARIAGGGVRIYEHNTTDTVYVELAAPGALAASYTITLPLAAPGSTAIMQMDSSGVVSASNTVANAVTLSGGIANNVTLTLGATAATNQDIAVSGTGDYNHGDKTLTLSATAYAWATGTTATISTGPIRVSAGAAADFYMPIPLRVGDRVKSITISHYGDGAADINNYTVVVTAASGGTSGIGVTTVSNPPASWVQTPLDLTDTTLAEGESLTLIVGLNATGIELGNVKVTYDHP